MTETTRTETEEVMREKIPHLHIFAQPCEHFEAHIVGNLEGLMVLRDALVLAIAHAANESYQSDTVYCDDGEGYHVVVERRVIGEHGDLGGPLPYMAGLLYDPKQMKVSDA